MIKYLFFVQISKFLNNNNVQFIMKLPYKYSISIADKMLKNNQKFIKKEIILIMGFIGIQDSLILLSSPLPQRKKS